jgi:flagellar biosynthesis/type III secretory pathway M-ring protein FliF/YscJ
LKEIPVYKDDKLQKVRDMAKEKPGRYSRLIKVWIKE